MKYLQHGKTRAVDKSFVCSYIFETTPLPFTMAEASPTVL